jgi:hypothetical protein
MGNGIRVRQRRVHVARTRQRRNRQEDRVGLAARETSDSLRSQIDELRIEATRLLSESEKTKRAAEILAERIKRLENTAY